MARSALNPCREDDIENETDSEPVGNEVPSSMPIEPAAASPPIQLSSPHYAIPPMSSSAVDADDFIVEDGGDLGHGFLLSISIGTSNTDTIHALTVRIPASAEKFTVHRFIHRMPDHIHNLLDTWVASSKGPVPPSHIYLGDHRGGNSNFKHTVKHELRDMYDVVALPQRSANWFLQRKMIITAST